MYTLEKEFIIPIQYYNELLMFFIFIFNDLYYNNFSNVV